jgi:hypothetical protein
MARGRGTPADVVGSPASVGEVAAHVDCNEVVWSEMCECGVEIVDCGVK